MGTLGPMNQYNLMKYEARICASVLGEFLECMPGGCASKPVLSSGMPLTLSLQGSDEIFPSAKSIPIILKA